MVVRRFLFGVPYVWWWLGVPLCTGVACVYTHVCIHLREGVDLDSALMCAMCICMYVDEFGHVHAYIVLQCLCLCACMYVGGTGAH